MRDFIYNKSDVLLAILIIVVAAFVIFVRVQVILDYSSGTEHTARDYIAPILPFLGEREGTAEAETPAAETEAPVAAETEAPTAAETETPTAAEAETAPVAEAEAEPAEEAQTPPAEETAPVAAGSTTATQGPAPTPEYVKFSVKQGDVASIIADNLIAAGLVNDKAAFLAAVDAKNAAMSLKIGEFEIPKGATNEEIIDILVG